MAFHVGMRFGMAPFARSNGKGTFNFSNALRTFVIRVGISWKNAHKEDNTALEEFLFYEGNYLAISFPCWEHVKQKAEFLSPAAQSNDSWETEQLRAATVRFSSTSGLPLKLKASMVNTTFFDPRIAFYTDRKGRRRRKIRRRGAFVVMGLLPSSTFPSGSIRIRIPLDNRSLPPKERRQALLKSADLLFFFAPALKPSLPPQ